ncbi:MAG: hypothetical protein KC731_18285 [Myxococcales bacterium]|nr:hypothetical protein [Myxococcales bacterium]
MSSVEAPPALPEDDLAELERRLQKAFATGDEQEVEVLGYGEVSSVLSWRRGESGYACKRLPDFEDQARFDRYAALFHRYLEELAAGGLRAVPTSLQTLAQGSTIAAWCIQPLLASDHLMPKVMREATESLAVAHFDAILDRILATVSPGLGLDGQLSNWVLQDGEPRYLDLTTPLLRDAAGHDQLDTDLFLASLPWALRGAVRRFMLDGIIDKYHQPRGVVLDLVGNLHKEGLEHLVDPFLELANRRLEGPPITAAEVKRYYRDDAATWSLLQRLRRADRAWQRRVRRRPYPFLLPGAIER